MFDIADAKTLALNLLLAGEDVYVCPENRMAQIQLLQITNVDGGSAADLVGYVYRAANTSTAYFAKSIEIPINASYNALGEKPSLWLKVGDKIHLSASADGDLDALITVMEYYLPTA